MEETAVSEPETAIQSTTPALIVQPGNRGALYAGGVPGNKGGPGAPRTSVRHLARKKLPRAVRVLDLIMNGRGFMKDADGKRIELTYGHVISAAKELRELGLGPDSIPEAMIVATGRLVAMLHELFPEAMARALTEDELRQFGNLLEQDLSNARVVGQ